MEIQRQGAAENRIYKFKIWCDTKYYIVLYLFDKTYNYYKKIKIIIHLMTSNKHYKISHIYIVIDEKVLFQITWRYFGALCRAILLSNQLFARAVKQYHLLLGIMWTRMDEWDCENNIISGVEQDFEFVYSILIAADLKTDLCVHVFVII